MASGAALLEDRGGIDVSVAAAGGSSDGSGNSATTERSVGPQGRQQQRTRLSGSGWHCDGQMSWG